LEVSSRTGEGGRLAPCLTSPASACPTKSSATTAAPSSKRDSRYCPRCGVALTALPLAVPGALLGGPFAVTEGPPPFPLRFEVEYPEKVSRATTLVRLILAVPQLLIIYALSTVTGIITFVAWFAILFTQPISERVVRSSRWSPPLMANVFAYTALLCDEYPPFSTDAGLYPVTYEVAYRRSSTAGSFS